ncbi:ras guanine nucleotide exchange factor domain-containing protein [Chytridium lagenaria]|nr:ras guanine nucleotide exchange factor domain-containing protein [Chytridium lagenaria]KAI8852919.1 ras guanine nucleotide exchange factor domain-containing protein [Chytridium lagenaria]
MALQITKAEAERFVAITRDELLSFGWSRMDKAIEVCPNIGRKIHTFNALSRFVTLSIVSMRSARDRGKVLKNHIRLAQSLVGSMAFDPAGKKGGSIPQNGMMSAGTRRNFDSAMAIVSALQGAAVARLKGSWKELSQKYRTAYEDSAIFYLQKIITNSCVLQSATHKAYHVSLT